MELAICTQIHCLASKYNAYSKGEGEGECEREGDREQTINDGAALHCYAGVPFAFHKSARGFYELPEYHAGAKRKYQLGNAGGSERGMRERGGVRQRRGRHTVAGSSSRLAEERCREIYIFATATRRT